MAAGQGSLAIAELPFIYSIVNIIAIGSSGQIDFNHIYLAGIFAGTFGTFLVIFHPFQRGISKWWKDRISKVSNYTVKALNPGSAKKIATEEIDRSFLELSLDTTSINYEKDKIAGIFYFIVILCVLAASLLNPQFQGLLKIDFWTSVSFIAGIGVMVIISAHILKKNLFNFKNSLQLSAIYVQMESSSRPSTPMRGWLDVTGRSIDLNNWKVAKQMIDRMLRERHGIS